MNIQPAVLCKVAKEDLHAFCDERAFILYSSSKKFFHDQRGGIHHQRSFIRHQRSSFIIKQACFTRNCDENTFMLYSSLSSRAETTLKTTLSPFPYLSHTQAGFARFLGIWGFWVELDIAEVTLKRWKTLFFFGNFGGKSEVECYSAETRPLHNFEYVILLKL